MTPNITENIKNIYNRRFTEGNNVHERVNWNDYRTQYLRFAEIFYFVDSLNTSILDVGCGNGELLNFLNFHGYVGRYLGVDVNEFLVQEAQQRFPQNEFTCFNFFEKDMNKHDCVIMSGVFNDDYGQSLEYIYKFLDRMFAVANHKVIFNAITTETSFRSEGMYYINISKLISHITKNITTKFEIRHGFLPYNYTVSLVKTDKWESLTSKSP